MDKSSHLEARLMWTNEGLAVHIGWMNIVWCGWRLWVMDENLRDGCWMKGAGKRRPQEPCVENLTMTHLVKLLCLLPCPCPSLCFPHSVHPLSLTHSPFSFVFASLLVVVLSCKSNLWSCTEREREKSSLLTTKLMNACLLVNVKI